MSIERSWMDGRLAGLVFWLLVVLLACAVVGLSLSFSNLKEALAVMEPALPGSTLAAASGDKGATEAREADFTGDFKTAWDSTALLRELAGMAEANAVQMTTLALSHRNASLTALGRLDLSLALQAQYPSLLMFLRAVQQRYPEVSLEQLQMKRNSQTGQLDAAMTLVFWERPSVPASSMGGK